MAIKLSLANQKGGIGKTTSTIELAACLNNRGYKVLVIDLEQQCDTTKYSGGNRNAEGVYEVLKGRKQAKECIQQVREFDLLGSSSSLSNADDEFSAPLDVLKLKQVLEPVNDDYDFMIIDTNPGRNKLLNMAYIASDYVIIPTDTDDGSIDGIREVFSDVSKYAEAKWTDAEVMGIIFTRYENTSMHRYQEEEIAKILEENGSNAFFMKVRKGIAASESKTEGTSMQAGKHNSNPAIDYRRIADEIIDRITKLIEEG